MTNRRRGRSHSRYPMHDQIDWVTLGPDPHLATCRRCGRMEPKPPLPMPIDDFAKHIMAVVEAHRYCESPT